MFGTQDLKKLVECAGLALMKEDQYLRDCAQRRPWPGHDVGIRENPNERYYQFIIWRELRSVGPWRCETERHTYDLVLYDDTDKRVAFAEIKRWWSDSGDPELPGIRNDMAKLALLSVPGVMLIVTWGYKKERETNLNVLAKELGIERARLETYAFDTVPWQGDDTPTELLIVGFTAAKSLIANA